MEQLSASSLGNNELPTHGTPHMPALAMGKHSHHHTMHSALATLEALGVRAHRITVERSGREAVASGTVVGQIPPAGTPLLPDTRVRLRVAGLGFSHALPVGMWDSGGERELGTRELLAEIDDPLEKLKHWFHEGAPLFHLSPADSSACGRWLSLFGVDPSTWPTHLWYPLATLVANLAQYSCSHQGCAMVLHTVLGLPVKQFRYRPDWNYLPDAMCSGLGQRSSRLGVDLLLGDKVEVNASLEIEIGPVSVDRYEYFTESGEGQRLLRRLLEWVVPVSTRTEVRWSVLDRTRPPQLGVRDSNSRLGINTHMGGTLAVAQRNSGPQQAAPADDFEHATPEQEQPATGVLQL